MSRTVKVKLPVGSPKGTTLLSEGIIAKDTALGVSSPLVGFVDMAAFATRAGNAKTLQENGDKQEHLANSLYGQLLKKVGMAEGQNTRTSGTMLWFVLKVRDALMQKYRGSEDQAEEFGFTVVISQTGARRNVRVNIPKTNPSDLIDLANDIIEEDTALGVSSPLNGVVDMATFSTLTTTCDTLLGQWRTADEQAQSLHNQALALFGYAEGQTSDTPGTLYYDIVAVRDRLLDVYEGEEEQMSEWKFDVVIGRRKSGGKRNGVLKEGGVNPMSTSNINVAGLTITAATLLKLENPGTVELTYYFSNIAGGITPGPVVTVAPGLSIVRTAAEMGYNISNTFLNVRNQTDSPGEYRVTVGVRAD